jgi:hypothetical protein
VAETLVKGGNTVNAVAAAVSNFASVPRIGLAARSVRG